ncbi:mitochondrial import receptor subunit TOM20 homolog [Uranotaenia lowii]|uniref:mitochondrial import receptor subunit TOM20 homolog n=1 Tax=Uranotaenia lowii TaxID=190385 RepID=UPI00247AD9B2|nr:mitochondrial import receptor subunit TOM20 homolog [Uranotaenia lowii]
MDISRTTIGIAAGVAGTLFLGYCLYFDQKRRKDPDFKKKLRERRKAKKAAAAASGPRSTMPDMTAHEEVQRFFLQEIQMGEALISSGDIENGVEHLANAVIVCGQPAQLLQVLQQSLPAQVFTLLISRMRQHGNPNGESERAKLQDMNDDLE